MPIDPDFPASISFGTTLFGEEDFSLVPLSPDEQTASVRFCLVVRRRIDPAAGWFVPLFSSSDALVYLGALCDSAGNRKEWLEIWVQRPAGLAPSSEAGRLPEKTNSGMDASWQARCELLARQTPRAVYRGSWENTHPRPLYFDPESWRPIHPEAPGSPGGFWRLCEDDALLRRHGLTPFSTSAVRFLHVPGSEALLPFLTHGPVPSGSKRIASPDPEYGFGPGWIPWNPEGGLLFVRLHAPFTLRQFKEVLEGRGWAGTGQAAQRLVLNPEDIPFRESGYFQNNHGLMFSGRQGRAARLQEYLLLKLMLLREVVLKVAEVVRAEQQPLLDLHPDHFRVSLEDSVSKLPRCWSFSVQLARTCESVAVPVDAGGTRYFCSLLPPRASMYQPRQLSSVRNGRGHVRIRDVRTDGESVFSVEGTLVDSDATNASTSDIVLLELPVWGDRVPITALILPLDTLAHSEVRFRARVYGGKLTTQQRDALEQLKGVSFDNVRYEIIPRTSSPCDLFALAVISLELLIDCRRVSAAAALDELQSLARQIKALTATGPLDERRERILGMEPRFRTSLGPQNLVREEVPPEEVESMIPSEIWWATMDLLMRMIPGALADDDCLARDLGDANDQALEACFLPVLVELDIVIHRLQAILFADSTANAEALKVIGEFA